MHDKIGRDISLKGRPLYNPDYREKKDPYHPLSFCSPQWPSLSVTPATFEPFLACPWMPLSEVHKYLKTWMPDKRFQTWQKRRHSWMYLSSRCPSFLNGSIRNPDNGREHPYGSKKKKQKLGFPIKDFGNDRGRSSPLNVSIRNPNY